MTIGRSRNLAEQLDAVLDGRASEVPEELASLVSLAEELRDEVAGLELDPAVTEQHLNLVYRRSRATRSQRGARPVRQPVRQGAQLKATWRRRAAVSIVFAIVLLIPASFASGGAMPGDPLYPLKRGLEKVRLAAAVSPGADAATRTSIADVRLEELEGLLQAGEFGRVPDALIALQAAVNDARRAVAEARARGADSTEVAALESRLAGLSRVQSNAMAKALQGLPPATQDSIMDEIRNRTSTTVLGIPTTVTTTPGAGPTTTACQASRNPGACLTELPTTTTDAGATTTTEASTTTEPPPTTSPPPDTTVDSGGRGSGGASTDDTSGGSGGGGLVDTIIDAVLP